MAAPRTAEAKSEVAKVAERIERTAITMSIEAKGMKRRLSYMKVKDCVLLR